MDNKAPYTKWVLVPFWVIELLFEILSLAFGGLTLGVVLGYQNSGESCTYVNDQFGGYQDCTEIDSSVYSAAVGSAGASVGIAAVFFVLHIIQITLYATNRLRPAVNFGIELSRWFIWLIIWIVCLVSIAQGTTTALFVVWPSLLFIAYLGSFIYACVIFHRARTGRYSGDSYGAGAANDNSINMAPYQAPQGYQPTYAPYDGQTQVHAGGPGPYQPYYQTAGPKA